MKKMPLNHYLQLVIKILLLVQADSLQYDGRWAIQLLRHVRFYLILTVVLRQG